MFELLRNKTASGSFFVCYFIIKTLHSKTPDCFIKLKDKNLKGQRRTIPKRLLSVCFRNSTVFVL